MFRQSNALIELTDDVACMPGKVNFLAVNTKFLSNAVEL